MRISDWSSDVCSSDLSERAALKWAGEQQAWLAEQVGKAVVPVLVEPGAALPFRGIERHVDWAPAAPRAIRLDGDRLHVGGPLETLGRRIERWLKAEALELRSEEHTSELQSLMRISYAVFCLQ